MNYDELVRFAKWLQTMDRAYVFHHTPDDEDEEEYLNFDGTITPADVERFNQEAGR